MNSVKLTPDKPVSLLQQRIDMLRGRAPVLAALAAVWSLGADLRRSCCLSKSTGRWLPRAFKDKLFQSMRKLLRKSFSWSRVLHVSASLAAKRQVEKERCLTGPFGPRVRRARKRERERERRRSHFGSSAAPVLGGLCRPLARGGDMGLTPAGEPSCFFQRCLSLHACRHWVQEARSALRSLLTAALLRGVARQ